MACCIWVAVNDKTITECLREELELMTGERLGRCDTLTPFKDSRERCPNLWSYILQLDSLLGS
jgi:hypothetical protein